MLLRAWLVMVLGVLTVSAAEPAAAAPVLGSEMRSDSDCEQECPGDDAQGRCPVGCGDCVCCPGAAPAATVALPTVDAPRCERLGTVPVLSSLADGEATGVWRPPRSRA